MKIGIISDIHLFNKTASIERALSEIGDVDLLLIAGDIADRADQRQYAIFLQLIKKHHVSVPVYCVSGNHDNPTRDDTNYRRFERSINDEYCSIVDECGAFYKHINEQIDIMGVNPSYYQKQFFFPEKGRQLTFLEEKLVASDCEYHIVMCHPPLIAHNPQRAEDRSPYIVKEQDDRLQRIIDKSGRVVFVSGHTHVFPDVEFDDIHRNLYINDGSICPTTVKNGNNAEEQGNITLLVIDDNAITVTAMGIEDGKILVERRKTSDPHQYEGREHPMRGKGK